MTREPLSDRASRVDRNERGSSLVLVLVVSFFISMLAVSLLFSTDVMRWPR